MEVSRFSCLFSNSLSCFNQIQLIPFDEVVNSWELCGLRCLVKQGGWEGGRLGDPGGGY